MSANCILCRSNPPIENSHIIPKFAIRRLKEGSPVGTLVFSTDLDRVAQDGWKGPYLCTRCEGEFSKLEGWFCKNVYDPFLHNGSVRQTYKDELALFAASVLFRYIHFAIEKNHSKQQSAGLSKIFENLRQSLRTNSSTSICSYLYLQFLFPITSTVGDYPPGINTYSFETIDGECFQHVVSGVGSFNLVFVKFPAFFFLLSESDLKTVLSPANRVDSHRIYRGGGTLDSNPPSGTLLPLVHERILQGAIDIQTNYFKLSKKRLERVEKKIAASPNKEKTRAHKSFALDQQLLAAYEAAKK
jgi:hypothetical protein